MMKKTGLWGVVAALGLVSLLAACNGAVTTLPVTERVTAEQVVARAQGPLDLNVPLDLNRPETKGILAAWANWSSQHDDGFVVPPRCSVAFFKAIRVSDEEGGLVAFINVNCQADPASIFVIWQSKGKVSYQELTTERGEMQDVRDLRGDGQVEVVVRTSLGDGFTQFYWPDVYQWSGNGFVMKSKDYIQSYYAAEYLPEVSAMIGHAMEELDSSPGKPKDRIEAEKEGYRPKAVSLAILAECQEGLKRLAALSKSAAETPTERQPVP
jgi:hypothetical protein